MRAGLKVVAVSLVLASAHAIAGDAHVVKTDMVIHAAITDGFQGEGTHGRPGQRWGGPDEIPSLAFNAGEGRIDHSLHEEAEGGGAAIPSAHADRTAKEGAHAAPGPAKKQPPPEPGSWAMILAGLLGVGAMARRRMSQ